MSSGSQSHAARPTDLVALVTFDDEVRENEAITLERLGAAEHSSRPLSVALAQWLHLGRRMWVNVDGREVHGIATARDLANRTAWVIDTLIDAAGPGQGGQVIDDLLSQTVEAAQRAGVSHVLLRTTQESAVRESAMRHGFRPAMPERLWTGPLSQAPATAAVTIRPTAGSDQVALFHLYSRSAPPEARALLAMTRDEWEALRERRWLRGGTELIAEVEGRLVAAISFNRADDSVQFELLAESGAADAIHALLNAMSGETGDQDALSLVPRYAGSVEQVLLDRGFQPGQEYILQSHRLRRPIAVESKVPVGVPVPSGGGA